MKKSKVIIVIASAVLIIFSFYAYKIYTKNFLLNVEYSDGLEFCFNKLKQKDNKILLKKYFYFNKWNTKCKPCVKEMPTLDSLANTLKADIAYIYVSDESDEIINDFLEKKHISSNHFIYMNDMNYFISAVYKKMNNNFKAFPTHVIMDSTGQVLYFSQGSITSINLNGLHISEDKKQTFYKKMKDPLIVFLESLK